MSSLPKKTFFFLSRFYSHIATLLDLLLGFNNSHCYDVDLWLQGIFMVRLELKPCHDCVISPLLTIDINEPNGENKLSHECPRLGYIFKWGLYHTGIIDYYNLVIVTVML